MLILKKKTASLLAECIKEKFGEGLLSAVKVSAELFAEELESEIIVLKKLSVGNGRRICGNCLLVSHRGVVL